MASPVQIYIVPNCGLEIDCKNSAGTYRIKDDSKIAFKLQDEGSRGQDIWKGKMSPVTALTLPPVAKEKAGILRSALKFAALYPPNGLADKLDWAKHDSDINEKKDDVERASLKRERGERKWAYPFFSILGGYVYFDQYDNVVSVNSFSMIETKYVIYLTGPFTTDETIVRSLERSGRIETGSIDIFHEVGILEFVSNLLSPCACIIL